MSAQTVLIADDDAQIRELLELYLVKEGFAVEQAADGAEAILKAQQLKPDLIILDIMMPVLDGMEVCRQVRKFSRVPVIMLTARVEDEDRIMGLELGADDYVAKPFNPRELIARVKAVLRRAQGNEPAVAGVDVLNFKRKNRNNREIHHIHDEITEKKRRKQAFGVFQKPYRPALPARTVPHGAALIRSEGKQRRFRSGTECGNKHQSEKEQKPGKGRIHLFLFISGF